MCRDIPVTSSRGLRPWASSRPGSAALRCWVIMTTGRAAPRRCGMARRGGNQPYRQHGDFGSTDKATGYESAVSAISGPTGRILSPALGDATMHDAVIMLSHNPDYAETIRDRRVGLILSGHTHGGQIVMPGFGAQSFPRDMVRSICMAWFKGQAARSSLPGAGHGTVAGFRCGFSADRKSSRSP